MPPPPPPPPPKPVYGGNFSHEAVTLKIRSRSQKSNKLLILSDLYMLANLVTFHRTVHEILTCRRTCFWLKFGGLRLAVTLKIRSRWIRRYCTHKHLLAKIWQFKSRSDLEKQVKVTITKSALHHFPVLYPCKSGWNLPTSSWDMVHTSTFWLKFDSLNPAVTLKIRSRSPKPNQHFIMSECCIQTNLVKIHRSVHKISCKQESFTLTLTPTPTLTATPTGSAPKTICPPPLRWGT